MAYSVRADIEVRFSKGNIAKWADLDDDGVLADIESRITAAITYADAVIDARLRGGPYTIPFVASTLPELILDASAKLAGVWLYEARGVTDWDVESGKPQHQLHFQKNEVMKLLKELMVGRVRLDLTFTTSIPEVIREAT